MSESCKNTAVPATYLGFGRDKMEGGGWPSPRSWEQLDNGGELRRPASRLRAVVDRRKPAPGCAPTRCPHPSTASER